MSSTLAYTLAAVMDCLEYRLIVITSKLDVFLTQFTHVLETNGDKTMRSGGKPLSSGTQHLDATLFP